MLINVSECAFCKEHLPLRQTNPEDSKVPEIGGIYVHELEEEGKFFVKCVSCSAQGPEEITIQGAVKRWNKATIMAKLAPKHFVLNTED